MPLLQYAPVSLSPMSSHFSHSRRLLPGTPTFLHPYIHSPLAFHAFTESLPSRSCPNAIQLLFVSRTPPRVHGMVSIATMRAKLHQCSRIYMSLQRTHSIIRSSFCHTMCWPPIVPRSPTRPNFDTLRKRGPCLLSRRALWQSREHPVEAGQSSQSDIFGVIIIGSFDLMWGFVGQVLNHIVVI